MLSRSRILILVIVLPLLVVLAALLIVGGRTPSLTEGLSEYVATGHFTESSNQLIWNIAQSFVRGTQFEDRIVINASPQPDAINVYILRDDPKRYFKGIGCNCAYLGQQNVIVCDAELLEYFRHLIDVPEGALPLPDKAEASEANTYLNSRFSLFLLQWIIGHEIGHLVLHHGVGAYYFQPSSLLSLASHQQRSSRPIARRYEQEADTFIGKHLSRPEDQVWGWLALSSVIETMYGQALDQQRRQRGEALLSDDQLREMIFQRSITVELTDGPDIHPPWLIRALDMTTLLMDTYPAVKDTTGYVDAVRKSIHRKPGGRLPSTLCTAKVTPRYDVAAVLLERPVIKDYQWYVMEGFEYSRLTLYERAIMEFTKGIDLMVVLTKESHQPPRQLLEAYLQRGAIYFTQGKYETAIADWKAALELQSGEPRAHSDLGFAYYELNHLDEAIAQWRTAVTANPSFDDSWAGLGIALYAKGQTDEAITAYQKALTIETKYASIEWLRYERSWTKKSLHNAAILLRLIKH